jgi:hypothetical protein
MIFIEISCHQFMKGNELFLGSKYTCNKNRCEVKCLLCRLYVTKVMISQKSIFNRKFFHLFFTLTLELQLQKPAYIDRYLFCSPIFYY